MGSPRLRRFAFVLLLPTLACAHNKVSNFNLGMDEVLAGRDAEARPYFEAALNDPGDERRAAMELEELDMRRARDLMEQDPAGALEIYQSLLAQNAGNHRARMGAGRALEVQHKFDAAIEMLSADSSCKQCAHQLGEVYELRGRQHMADANYEAATADYEKALAVEESAEALIDISEMYTVAHHGSAMKAAESMRRAHDLLTHQNTTLQELWAVERRDLALYAASKHEFEAVDLALSIDDPRIALDDQGRVHALLDLKMDVARAYQEHQEYERGIALGQLTVGEAGSMLPAEMRAPFVAGLSGLYSRFALHLMDVGEARRALVLLGEGLQADPGNTVLSYQAALAMSAVDQDSAEEMMQRIPESSENWHRVHALVQAGRARHHLVEGNIEEAQAALTKAGDEYPDLLEIRMVRAEILIQTRVSDLGRGDYKLLRKHGTVTYPGGVPKRYAEALAEAQWCRARYEEEWVKLDPLRMPGFGARLATLEADITAFYPYKVRKLPGANPRIRFTNTKQEPMELTVSGPGIDETVKLAPGENKSVVFEEAGIAEIEFGDTHWALIAEQRTLIEVDL
jgi:tetratricopeptide (TPR) repeat protein